MALTGYAANANAYADCPVEAPRTIASAAGRVDSLTERLAKTRVHLEGLSETIGGPRPVGGGLNSAKVQPSGIVFRLNEGVDSAHSVLDDIEGLLAGISRSLG